MLTREKTNVALLQGIFWGNFFLISSFLFISIPKSHTKTPSPNLVQLKHTYNFNDSSIFSLLPQTKSHNPQLFEKFIKIVGMLLSLFFPFLHLCHFHQIPTGVG